MIRKNWKLAAAGAALLLASCGGGGPAFTSMVNFGDSLSDVGTYRVGTVAAVGGGEFTVNGAAPRNWTEDLAVSTHVAAPCAAQTGLLPNIPGFTGAAVVNHPECNNYAQGSARVTLPLGPNAAGLQAAPFNQFNIGLMAVPVATQVASYLSKSGGSFSGHELVTVWAGGNDIFMNFAGIGAAQAGGAGAVGAAMAAGWSSDVQNAVFAGGTNAVNAAVSAAVAAMGQAGTELATLVRTQLLAKGAGYVAVLNLPDVSITPFGLSLTAQQRGLLQQMVSAYNTQLSNGLAGSRALLVNVFQVGQQEAATPSAFGLTNVTSPACDPASPLNPLQGSSLGCTDASTFANSTHYQYADSVHPTPYAHQLISNLVFDQMHAAGWI
ncbi:MAG TPA: SGNH/GDSL hydrolase family protein [Ramlibacter sp.]|uniref:SGNH/GDSL hydrolase family protein n=1 Tax=Ramlibacter sp. TaxID=1917967 RepID=UPI002CC8D6E3|nr:SGNH/GDSL hydrolase family protein [Ramlibacter sp.]HVZ47126.1 SGNH/GDSL hydrolase family protein [Ramlibacter sp.]